MSGWNYRIIKKDDYLFIHEVYYNRNGKPKSWTVNPISVGATDVTEMRRTFTLMRQALKRPILIWKKTRYGREYLEEQ